MLRRLGTTALLALALAPAARADGLTQEASSGDAKGSTNPGSALRYVTLPTNDRTVLAAVRKRNGTMVAYRPLVGHWGTPVVTINGATAGLSPDGKLLVLGDAWPQLTALRKRTRILVVDVPGLRTHRRIELRGHFAFDAFSPSGRTLYLVQRFLDRDITRYRVRAYDLRLGRLLPGAIADREQRGWTMRGYPVARTTSRDGRWIYTLYRQGDNYPFVHALDTVAGRAVCVAVPQPWQNRPMSGELTLDGNRLLIADFPGARARYVLDTTTFRVAARPWTLGL